MKHAQKMAAGVLVTLALISLSGCEEEESNDLAKAQQCMDRITSSNFAQAENCMAYVAKHDSQQANILKCSIKMLAGGLTSDKITQAYIKLSGNGGNKEAAFISVLALSPASKATEAQAYCERSQLKGLIYISNLAVVGSTIASAGGAGGYDPSNPTDLPSDAEIANMLTSCTPPGGTCGGNFSTIGAAVTTVSSSYCTGDNATNDVCTKVNSAITNSGGNPTAVAKYLICQLQTPPKTYDSGTDACI